MLQLDKYNLGKDYLNPGHYACPGCGAAIAMKLALKVLGEKTIVVIPACCWAVIAGPYPQTALKVPILHSAFATSGVMASGIRAALDAKGDKETTVLAWAGDGGTYDIGLQSLSGAAERNEDFIYVCYDNEGYMNTGVQRSSATPYGSTTTTTSGLGWKKTRKKRIMDIISAHRIPYAATANIAYPDDLMNKFQKALEIKGGTRFIHILASCPPGWGIASELSIKVARLATQSNFFPLYEVFDGVDYKLNFKGDKKTIDYFSLQARFKQLNENELATIQDNIDRDWELLLDKTSA